MGRVDLTEFLNARIDEDQATAGAARKLREVAAKRLILAEHMPGEFERYGRTRILCQTCVTGHDAYMDDDEADPWPCATTRALAAVYSTHPDYRGALNP